MACIPCEVAGMKKPFAWFYEWVSVVEEAQVRYTTEKKRAEDLREGFNERCQNAYLIGQNDKTLIDRRCKITGWKEFKLDSSALHDDEFKKRLEKMKKQFPNLEVLNWKEISPEMSYMTEMMDLYNYIFIVIILFALLFGIINTMLMVVLERRKELGMLLAIGMSKGRVFSMIMLETVLLSLTGGLVGILMGWAVSAYFGTTPINLSMWAEGYSQLGYDTMVYTSIEPAQFAVIAVMVTFTGIIAALYPAYKALKYDPAEALRIE